MIEAPDTITRETSVATTQRVVVVNGNGDVLEQLETVLDAGHYDVIFVESVDHAYSQVKRLRPNLIILCVHIEDLDGFQVLSMLKMDEDTASIPVLTYTTEYEGQDVEGQIPRRTEDDSFLRRPSLRMN